ncbi:right-handed parallel beta-helix repeat-containing protein [Actinoplanes sp. NPDC051475]|uniref:right-handed parallel beta-helix repeat-containing protein n=1 Tax=Actinoplanes sp. NPDC051475 TaxID=3157225 RepID=UPI00344CCF2D
MTYLARRWAAAALLPLVSIPGLVGRPAQAAPADPPRYSLAATVAPAAMKVRDCRADAACVFAPDPSGADDHAALQAAVAKAATLVVPAVLKADGSVLRAARPATVLLGAGTYRLSRGLQLPPDVNLRGRGITDTTVSMITASWQNFTYGYLISWDYHTRRAGSSNLVADLTVNGNCREGAGAPVRRDLPGRPGAYCDFRGPQGDLASTNAGGGIAVGDRWTVRQVRFTNLEYFKIWVGDGVKDVRIVDNRFDNWGGAESGDEDNVGGGSRNDGVVVEDNQFDKTIRGNSFDFTNAIRTTVRHNSVTSDRAVAAARGDKSLYGNMYLEGLVQATVADNVLYGAQISLKTNGGYDHSGENRDITNPRDSVVSGNRISHAEDAGIVIVYDDYRDADGTAGTTGGWDDHSTAAGDHVVRPGGNNVVRDNVVRYSGQSGILVLGSYGHAKNAPDTITGNRVRNSGWGGSTGYDTGAGLFDTAGIGLSIGEGDRIYGNVVGDRRAHRTTWYGIQLGARRAPTVPSNTVLTGPAGETNAVTRVIAGAYRDVALAPEAPAGLTASGATLSWEESYALEDRPIAGYRVYRDDELVGDVPVGSATIPGNLLTADEAGFEDAAAGIAGWTAGFRTTLDRVDTGAVGTGAMSLTSSGSGEVSFAGRALSVTPGQSYTSVISAKAAGAGRWVRAGLKFTTATGSVYNLATNNHATTDSANGWITSSYTFQAPADAVSVQAWYLIEGTVADEVHLVDRLGLVAGTRTEQWIDPEARAKTSAYHVVAYTAGANSTLSTVAVS